MIQKEIAKRMRMVFVIIAVFLCCQSAPFSPIQAGTFYITGDDLKGIQKSITKQVELQTPWSIFNQNLNIDIVCAISSVNIDERIGMHFTYKLSEKDMGNNNFKKIIIVEITDKKGFTYAQFKLGVNFFIAQNIRVGSYNMTSYQEHLMNQSLTEQQSNQSNKQVHNEIFLFPNGFSSFNRTHHVMYNYVTIPYDMYTIHFMRGMGSSQQEPWKQEKEFIYFRYVLFPRYPYGYKQCGAVYQSNLSEDFYFSCDKKGVDGYFYGLMGYEGANFVGEFAKTKSGFSFHIQRIDQDKKYNVIGFPFLLSNKFEFIDNRDHSYTYFEEKNLLATMFIVIVIIIITIVAFIVLKKRKIVYFDLQEQKNMNSQASQSVQKSSSPKKSRLGRPSNKKSTGLNGNNQKTSDQQMKQEEHPQFPQEEIFTTQNIAQDQFNNQSSFTIE